MHIVHLSIILPMVPLAADTVQGSMVANGTNGTNGKNANDAIGGIPNVACIDAAVRLKNK